MLLAHQCYLSPRPNAHVIIRRTFNQQTPTTQLIPRLNIPSVHISTACHLHFRCCITYIHHDLCRHYPRLYMYWPHVMSTWRVGLYVSTASYVLITITFTSVDPLLYRHDERVCMYPPQVIQTWPTGLHVWPRVMSTWPTSSYVLTTSYVCMTNGFPYIHHESSWLDALLYMYDRALCRQSCALTCLTAHHVNGAARFHLCSHIQLMITRISCCSDAWMCQVIYSHLTYINQYYCYSTPNLAFSCLSPLYALTIQAFPGLSFINFPMQYGPQASLVGSLTPTHHSKSLYNT
jgi:hypothetical protein